MPCIFQEISTKIDINENTKHHFWVQVIHLYTIQVTWCVTKHSSIDLKCKQLDLYLAEKLRTHLLFQHLQYCHLLKINQSALRNAYESSLFKQNMETNLQTSKILFSHKDQFYGFHAIPCKKQRSSKLSHHYHPPCKQHN